MIREMCLIVTLLGLFGCMPIPQKYTSIEPIRERSKSYRLNEKMSASTGAVMFTNNDIIMTKGYISNSNMQVSQGVVNFNLPARTKCVPIAKYEDGLIMCYTGINQQGTTYMPLVGAHSYNMPICLMTDETNVVYGYGDCEMPQNRRAKENYLQYSFGKLDEYEIYEKGSFRQELLYNGKSKDNIRIQYREFNDDFARPAFFQELTYDLNESKTVAFRNFTIDIVEATNSDITFIIRKD